MENLILKSLPSAIPFVGHMDVVPLEAKPSIGKARLSQRKEVENHLSSIHAAALFGLAETSAAALVTSLFFDQITALRIVASRGEIDFLRVAKGDIDSTAKLAASSTAIQDALARQGKAEFSVYVDLVDQAGADVASARFLFSVKSD